MYAPSMVFGLGHVTLEVPELVGPSALLTDLLFLLRFSANSHWPSAALEPYPSDSNQLELAIFDHPRGATIELTRHSTSSEGPGYEVLFGQLNGILPAAAPSVHRSPIAIALTESGLARRPARGSLPMIPVQIWFDAAPDVSATAPVVTVIAEVEDLALSSAFWGQFARCTAVSTNESWAHFKFRRGTTALSMDLLLVPGDRPATRHSMSALGFSSVGILSTDITRDIGRALGLGGACLATPHRVDVNDVSLDVAIIESPSGHLVELVQVARETKGCDEREETSASQRPLDSRRRTSETSL